MDQMTLLIACILLQQGERSGSSAVNSVNVQRNSKRTRDAMKIGDKVVTIGGLHGIIYNIDIVNNTVDLDCEGVILTFRHCRNSHVVTESAPTNHEVILMMATEEEQSMDKESLK